MGLAQPQVYSFPPFSLMCSFFFFWLATCQVEQKNISHSKRNALTAASLLPLYKTIPVCLFICLQTLHLRPFSLSTRLQTCCSLPFCTTSKRRLLTLRSFWPPELQPYWPFRCPKRFLIHLFPLSLTAHGQWRAGLRPWRVKGCSHR